MRFVMPAVLIVGSLMVGTAWAQSSSSGGGGSGAGAAGGGGTGASSGSTAPSTGAAPLTGDSPAVPRLGQDANTGRTLMQNRANTAPTPPSGSEGSTGGARTSGGDATTTGGISGTNRRPGEPSAIGPSPREEELLREGEQLEQKARRGLCEGC